VCLRGEHRGLHAPTEPLTPAQRSEKRWANVTDHTAETAPARRAARYKSAEKRIRSIRDGKPSLTVAHQRQHDARRAWCAEHGLEYMDVFARVTR